MSPRELAEGAIRALLSELVIDLVALDEIAAQVIDARIDETDARPRARSAAYLALGLHRYYTAIETIFERIARQLDGRMPGGSEWHKTLLGQIAMPIDELRPALIDPDTRLELGHLLAFRHFIRHAYAVELDAGRLELHRTRVERVHPVLRASLHGFKAHLAAMVALSEG